MELRDNKKKDVKVLLYLQQALNKTLFLRIMVARKAKKHEKLWDEFKRSNMVITSKL